VIVHNKLVRDRIPEIIEADGGRPIVRVLDEEDYRAALLTKLGEETAEYRAEGHALELVDILEVVYALAAVHGLSIEQIGEQRRVKRAERGGFERRLFLESVE
jgi:predicted house-cleaning noncanonical NTP pyrophosphatase (MazG superfamily)